MNIKETVSRVFGKGGDEKPPAPDALTLIQSDHREVDAMFAIALGDHTPAARRRATTAKICEALTVHAQMEEALLTRRSARRVGRTSATASSRPLRSTVSSRISIAKSSRAKAATRRSRRR